VEPLTTTVPKHPWRARTTVTQSLQTILHESKFLKGDLLSVQAYGRHAISSLRYKFNFLGTLMNKDQIKGSAKDVVGKVQREAGALVGSTKQQVNGAMLQTEGKVQKHLGDIKEVLNDAGHDLQNAAKKIL
jgi:uncharacterized protein YjbJ (UPF0337 family)